jgi:hypothetical protein
MTFYSFQQCYLWSKIGSNIIMTKLVFLSNVKIKSVIIDIALEFRHIAIKFDSRLPETYFRDEKQFSLEIMGV